MRGLPGGLCRVKKIKIFSDAQLSISMQIRFNSLSNFVDFVDEDERIFNLDFLQALDYLPWHGPHVGSPVSLDFGNVRHSADAESKVLAVQCSCDRPGYGRFADSWGSMETQNFPLGRAL